MTLIQRVAGQRSQADKVLEEVSRSSVARTDAGQRSTGALLDLGILQEGETYANLYIRLLSKLSRNDTLQFILVLVGDFIASACGPSALSLL